MEITEELKGMLENPFGGLKENDLKGFQDKCEEIAEKLLKNYCIQCGEKKYYFAEIEFYYYDKERWNNKWNEKTYPRDKKDAGDFFFHYSGVDICFNSKFDEGKFGGILIRSLKDDGHFITGPSVCMLEILNNCSGKTWPILTPSPNQKCEVCKNPIQRYGITYKDNQEDKKLCFYDERLKEKLRNEFENATWDYSKKKKKNIIRYYHRFDDKNENNK